MFAFYKALRQLSCTGIKQLFHSLVLYIIVPAAVDIINSLKTWLFYYKT